MIYSACLALACSAGTDPGGEDGGDPCVARCEALAVCGDLDGAECRSTCEVSPGASCLVAASNCLGAQACVDAHRPPLVPFHAGPYGTNPHDVAGPFTVPTLAGDWDFETEWTGEHSYVFIARFEGHDFGRALWRSDPGRLLDASPASVHYFFVSHAGPAVEAVEAMRIRVETALGVYPDAVQAAWRERLHYVTVAAGELEGWLGEVFTTGRALGSGDAPLLGLSIDRFQRLRETGLLAPVGGTGELRFYANEARYYDYEHALVGGLDEGDTVVRVFDGRTVDSTAEGEVTLPDLAAFDRLEVDLTLGCPDHLDSTCGEWDYLANLHLCDPAGACDTELARWVTPYHREGRWVTDVSALMPLFAGGTQTLQWSSRPQPNGGRYVVTLDLRFAATGTGRPDALTPLFDGGGFDASYNDKYAPLTVPIPADAVRVELVALITGHGFGVEVSNCAEFCNHTHHFTVNGNEHVVEHPEAGSREGCMARVDDGVVPNQFGTWTLGRGGWCPGLDVAPHVVDVTADVTPGTSAVIEYRALYEGAPYVPVPAANPQGGFPGRIDLKSWLLVRK